jgi:acyl-CoA reductase-like NAD-dependent aldehyde dehydrogenase
VLGYLKLAKDEGAEVLTGGGTAPAPNERCKNGWFVQPTVLANLPPTARTNQEEIFGPVVTVAPFDDEAGSRSRSRTERLTAYRPSSGRATSRARIASRSVSTPASSG